MGLFGKKHKKENHPETSHYAPHHQTESNEPFTQNPVYSNDPGYTTHSGPPGSYGTGPSPYDSGQAVTQPLNPMPEVSYKHGHGYAHSTSVDPRYTGQGSDIASGGAGYYASGNEYPYSHSTGAGHGVSSSHGPGYGGGETFRGRSAMEREREAEMMRTRNDKIAEAERLEQEAQRLREKANYRGQATTGSGGNYSGRRGYADDYENQAYRGHNHGGYGYK